MTTIPLPSFVSPPVQEVAFGIKFADLGLKTVHIGQFYEAVRNDFPNTDDLAPYVDESDFGFQLIQLPQLRRVKLMSSDGQNTLQIQGNRIIFNWVKSTKTTIYPRYPSVYRSFRTYWDTFAKFAKETISSELNLLAYELTYVNELKKSSTSILTSTEEAIQVFRWNDIKRETIGEPSNLNFALNFELPNGLGKAVVSVNPAKRADGEEVLLFILKCAGPANVQPPDVWFAMAHEWIVRGFAELTSAAAHKQWEREA